MSERNLDHAHQPFQGAGLSSTEPVWPDFSWKSPRPVVPLFRMAPSKERVIPLSEKRPEKRPEPDANLRDRSVAEGEGVTLSLSLMVTVSTFGLVRSPPEKVKVAEVALTAGGAYLLIRIGIEVTKPAG